MRTATVDTSTEELPLETVVEAPLYNGEGEELGTVEIDPEVFGITPNLSVAHQVITALRAAARSGSASVKTRAEVRGGGRKPWRQKGTGRARHGSIRSPIWVGGGIAHGPKPKSFAQHTPKKMKRLALRSTLSVRASEQAIMVIEPPEWEAPKTKTALSLLETLGITGKILLVVADRDGVVARSFRNLPDIMIIESGHITAYNVLWATTLLLAQDTLAGISAQATGIYPPVELDTDESADPETTEEDDTVSPSDTVEPTDSAEAEQAEESEQAEPRSEVEDSSEMEETAEEPASEVADTAASDSSETAEPPSNQDEPSAESTTTVTSPESSDQETSADPAETSSPSAPPTEPSDQSEPSSTKTETEPASPDTETQETATKDTSTDTEPATESEPADQATTNIDEPAASTEPDTSTATESPQANSEEEDTEAAETTSATKADEDGEEK